MNDILKASIMDRLKANHKDLMIVVMGGEDKDKAKLNKELSEEGKAPVLDKVIGDGEAEPEKEMAEADDMGMADELMDDYEQEKMLEMDKEGKKPKGLFGKMKQNLAKAKK